MLRVITSRYHALITYIQPIVEAISATQTQKSLTQSLISCKQQLKSDNFTAEPPPSASVFPLVDAILKILNRCMQVPWPMDQHHSLVRAIIYALLQPHPHDYIMLLEWQECKHSLTMQQYTERTQINNATATVRTTVSFCWNTCSDAWVLW